MDRAIRWSPRAAEQLDEICTYIAADSPRYAAVFARRVLSTITSIPANPWVGRMVPEYQDPNLRERIYQGYRLVYRVRDEVIEVVAVCHGSRNL